MMMVCFCLMKMKMLCCKAKLIELGDFEYHFDSLMSPKSTSRVFILLKFVIVFNIRLFYLLSVQF